MADVLAVADASVFFVQYAYGRGAGAKCDL